jgi:peptidoglycan/xylan/chitin deacetylase (PgdA/CDA1 family)
VSLPELARIPDAVDAVALTFDDAIATVAEQGVPLLRAHGFTATVFVVSGRVGRDNHWGDRIPADVPSLSLMSWDDLGRLAEAGFAIAAHTRQHPRLTRCTEAELEDELGGCAEDLARELGRRPDSFAYPYGDLDGRVVAAAGRHFAQACTTEFRVLEAGDSVARWPRLDAHYFRRGSRLTQWGTTSFRRYVAWRRTLRVVRRAVA